MTLEDDIRFSTLDYAIFVSFFAGSLLIGIYHACKSGKTTINEYFMGNRQMSILPVTASLITSHFSSALLLGIATEVYYYGGAYFLTVIEGFFGALATAYIYLPVFHEIGCTSIFEYLELRFNKCVQLIASIGFQLQVLSHLSFVIYAPALIASQVTGFSVWTCVLSIGALCTFYTALGGIKAVMWADTLQGGFMLASNFAVLIFGCMEMGGIDYVWQKNMEHDRLKIFNFDTNLTLRYTFWSIIFGQGMNSVTKFAGTQHYIQRYLSTPNLKTARWTIFLNYVGCSIFYIATTLLGILLYSIYWDCDPYTTKKIESRDQLLSYFVLQRLGKKYTGLAGLFAAGLLSCAISTLSSSINSAATVTFKQIIQPYCTTPIFKNHPMATVKLLAFIYGIMSIAFVPIVEKLDGILPALMSSVSITTGPTFGFFTLGMLFPRATPACALIGGATGFVVTAWIFVGANIYKSSADVSYVTTDGCNMSELFTNSSMIAANQLTTDSDIADSDNFLSIYKISFLWLRVIAVVLTIFTGVFVSFLFGLDQSEKVDPKLISPIVHKIKIFFKTRKIFTPKSSLETTQNANENVDKFSVLQNTTTTQL